MKKLLLVVLALIVVLIGALVAAPFLIPIDTLRQQAEAQVERATGRALAIEGPVDLQIFPTLALEAENVRFANLPGSANADMATLQALQVELKLWPLLSGTVEVDRFVLIEPVVHLEVDQEGRPNWQFGGAAEAGTAPAPEQGGSDGGPPQLPISELALGDIRLENGTITYTDARSGASERVENVNMALQLENLRSPLQANGSLAYKNEQVTLDLRLESPLALIQNGLSQARTTISSDLVELGFDGQLSNAEVPGVEGGLDLRVTSIRELAAWLAEPLALPGDGLRTFEIAGRLEASPERVAFQNAEITLDDITAEGGLVAELSGPVPKVTGRLDTGAIDLNPYLPPPAETEAEAQAEGEGAGEVPGEPGAQAWSDEPIAIPPMGGVELDFELSTDGLTYREIELGPTVLALALRENTLTADLTDMVLYQGHGEGTLRVEVQDGVPAIEQTFTLNSLQAAPFLSDAADFERLEGTVDAELDVTTRGRSERELVQNLNGEGRAVFSDGAIVGINLAAMVRNIGSAFLNPAADETRKTDFAELSGSFAIQDGVLRNDDLRLQAPLLRLTGQGRIDMPERTIDYRIEPTAAPTLEGQGGEQDLAGLLVPVVIEGSWEDPSIRPDLSGVIETAIQNPEQLKRQLEQLEERTGGLGEAAEQLKERLEQPGQGGGVESLIEGVTGAIEEQQQGGEQPAGEQQQEGGEQAPQDPTQRLLKGLFGN